MLHLLEVWDMRTAFSPASSFVEGFVKAGPGDQVATFGPKFVRFVRTDVPIGERVVARRNV